MGATFVSLSGDQLHAQATIFVLAAGAIENARLLLLSGENALDTPGNRYGWVGRCFMEHPRVTRSRLSRSALTATFYDLHPARNGTRGEDCS